MGPVEAVEWYRPQFRAGVVAAAYLAYPVVVDVLSRLPPPNSVEGQYYFSLISIVYATLTAATITDASTRLSALRAAAVDESSMLLPLVKRLEAARLDGAVFKRSDGSRRSPPRSSSPTYLTLDAAPETTAFGFEGGAFDASIGVRVLFSCVAGALVVFNSLSEDLNRPFDGSSELSSETVSSSIRQLRATIEPHL
ncbi:ubiquitinyl hydrolase [Aureococcus anophagefferens]|nr:ubiquitinyl hydrolase [Aureococcus anophagefferens]